MACVKATATFSFLTIIGYECFVQFEILIKKYKPKKDHSDACYPTIIRIYKKSHSSWEECSFFFKFGIEIQLSQSFKWEMYLFSYISSFMIFHFFLLMLMLFIRLMPQLSVKVSFQNSLIKTPQKRTILGICSGLWFWDVIVYFRLFQGRGDGGRQK